MGAATIFCIPEEVKQHILGSLSQKDAYQCLLANKRFHTAALYKLWQTVQLSTPQAIQSFRHGLQSPSLPGRYIQKLTLVSSDPDILKDLAQPLQLLFNLRSLDLTLPNTNLESPFALFPRNCPLLSHCKISAECVSDDLLLSLGTCKTLKTLELGFNGKRGCDLQLLGSLSVESLTLTGCSTEVYDQALCSITPLRSLKHLCITTSSDRLYTFEPSFLDNCLFQLETLSLDFFKVNAPFLAFLSKQTSLKKFNSPYLHFPIDSLHFLAIALPETCGMAMSGLPTYPAKYMCESNYFLNWAADLDTTYFII